MNQVGCWLEVMMQPWQALTQASVEDKSRWSKAPVDMEFTAGDTLTAPCIGFDCSCIITNMDLRVSPRPGSDCTLADCFLFLEGLARSHTALERTFPGCSTMTLCASFQAWEALSGRPLRVSWHSSDASDADAGDAFADAAYLNLEPLLCKGCTSSFPIAIRGPAVQVRNRKDMLVQLVPLSGFYTPDLQPCLAVPTTNVLQVPVHACGDAGQQLGTRTVFELDGRLPTAALYITLPHGCPALVRILLALTDSKKTLLLRAEKGVGFLWNGHENVIVNLSSGSTDGDGGVTLDATSTTLDDCRRAWLTDRVGVHLGRVVCTVTMDFEDTAPPPLPKDISVYALSHNVLNIRWALACYQMLS
jgi:hypothetical protein